MTKFFLRMQNGLCPCPVFICFVTTADATLWGSVRLSGTQCKRLLTLTLSFLSGFCFLLFRIGGGVALLLSGVIYGTLLAGVIDVQFVMDKRALGRWVRWSKVIVFSAFYGLLPPQSGCPHSNIQHMSPYWLLLLLLWERLSTDRWVACWKLDFCDIVPRTYLPTFRR